MSRQLINSSLPRRGRRPTFTRSSTISCRRSGFWQKVPNWDTANHFSIGADVTYNIVKRTAIVSSTDHQLHQESKKPAENLEHLWLSYLTFHHRLSGTDSFFFLTQRMWGWGDSRRRPDLRIEFEKSRECFSFCLVSHSLDHVLELTTWLSATINLLKDSSSSHSFFFRCSRSVPFILGS